MKDESPNEKVGDDHDDRTDNSDEDEERVPLNIDEKIPSELKHSKYTVPQDRGWAWVILAGCVFLIFIFGGLLRSFGVFFLQYQKRFNSNASETATMSVIQNLVLSFSALFVMTIGLQKFSCRTVIMVGGLSIVLSYLITAFTSNIYVFYIVQGVLGGFGFSCITPPLFTMLGIYFSKHKGLANSIFTAGGSAGGLVFGPVLIKLFEEYGYTGAMLIVSGLFCNIFVSGTLMRPPEFYTRHAPSVKAMPDQAEISNDDKNSIGISKQNQNTVSDETTEESHHVKDPNRVHKSTEIKIEMQRMVSYDPELLKANGNHSPVLARLRASSVGERRTTSEDSMSSTKHKGSLGKLSNILTAISRSQVAIYVSDTTMCGSFVDVNNPAPSTPLEACQPEVTSEVKKGVCQRVQSGFISMWRTIFDLDLLRDVTFLYFLIMAFCSISSIGLIPVFIPTFADEIGVSNERIGLLVSVITAIDFFAKIGMGVVADRKWIARNKIVGLSLVFIGTACQFVRFIKTFETLVIFTVIAGLFCGQYMSTFAVILSELLGQDRFKHSLGFATLTHGISIAIFFPLAGRIKDDTKSYVNVFHLIGALALVAGICGMTIPLVQNWATSKRKQTDTESK